MKIVTGCALTLVSCFAFAEQKLSTLTADLTSQDKPPVLLELYTSEGCSSCPRADRWLRKLDQAEGLWTEYVPMAFHVDYWNYLGWKDRFSSQRYSDRQRKYQNDGQINSVYTPGFIVSGQEWRSWFSNPSLEYVLGKVQTPENKAILQLNVENGHYQISYSGELSDIGDVNFALLGMGIKTSVKRGENHGRNLEHDFVVLDWQKLDKNRDNWTGQIDSQYDHEVEGYAVVAWVENADINTPKQVVAGYLGRSEES